jgi:RNA polymerase sigma-70 factor (ECF subfamily)
MDERTRHAIAQWTLAQPAVTALVRTLVADPREREDLVQSIAVEVIGSFAGYDPARPFLPWALGVARHQIAASRRGRQRRPLLLEHDALDALTAALGRVADGERAMLDRLGECLERLDPRGREICDLRYGRELAPQRIAEALAMQPNTVSKVLQRVRDSLRICLEERHAEARR